LEFSSHFVSLQMLETFGGEYAAYMARTKLLVPGIR